MMLNRDFRPGLQIFFLNHWRIIASAPHLLLSLNVSIGDLVWFDPGVGYVLPGEVVEFHKAAQVNISCNNKTYKNSQSDGTFYVNCLKSKPILYAWSVTRFVCLSQQQHDSIPKEAKNSNNGENDWKSEDVQFFRFMHLHRQPNLESQTDRLFTWPWIGNKSGWFFQNFQQSLYLCKIRVELTAGWKWTE